MRHKIIHLLLVCIFTYILFVLALYIMQRNMIYYPNKAVPLPIAGIEVAQVITQDQHKIAGWFIAGKGIPQKTILFFHGNAGHHGMRIYKAMEYTEQGYNVLLAGYRGYGGNEGAPSEEGFYADGRAYIQYLEQEHGILSRDIIVYGESIGTGTATQIAAEYDVHALVLEMPFASLLEIVKSSYFFVPVNYLLKDRFMNDEKIAHINAPLLIMHGTKDTIIPVESAKRLYAIAKEPKVFAEFPEGTHVNLYQYGASAKVLEFLSEIDK